MATKTPWKFKEVAEWPFELQIVDSDGQEVYSERRYAYSTRHKTLDDVYSGAGFKADEREGVVRANAEQRDKISLIVTAVNSHDALIAEIEQCALEIDEAANFFESSGFPGLARVYRKAAERASALSSSNGGEQG